MQIVACSRQPNVEHELSIPQTRLTRCKSSSHYQTNPTSHIHRGLHGALNNMTRYDGDPYRLSTNLAQKMALQPGRVREGRTCTLLPCYRARPGCRVKETESSQHAVKPYLLTGRRLGPLIWYVSPACPTVPGGWVGRCQPHTSIRSVYKEYIRRSFIYPKPASSS